jgi:uncharacterized membrane-anchored protein
MTTEYLVALVTVIVEIIMGHVTKKIPKISNELIPIQNLLIGVIIATIEYLITKDFKISIAASGLLAGGTYDVVHNLRKIKEGEK